VKSAHAFVVGFVVFVCLLAVLLVGLLGRDYYLTPIAERPFRPDYAWMKPSGTYSHGLGIIGASMIVIGVSMYSTRKRVRALWNIGKLSRWLETHIALCLLGPILVTYHTTFKAGGVAAISLWTMLSVAASGIVGRFLYGQIPRSVSGIELTIEQLETELKRLSDSLSASELGNRVGADVLASFANTVKPTGIFSTVTTFLRLGVLRLTIDQRVGRMLHGRFHTRASARDLRSTARTYAAMLQKVLVYQQAERLFHYWHAVHLPFTVIMFITLAAHVTVTLLLGYNWVF
jgi:hypothetical protein